MRLRTAVAAALGLWLVVGVAVTALPGAPPRDAGAGTGQIRVPELDHPVVLLAALTPFPACDDLLAHVQEHALDLVGPYGLPGGMAGEGDGLLVAVEATGDSAGEERAAAAPAAAEGQDFSGTNVQEQGVDEPDVVKTDGRVLYTTVDDRVRAVGISGDVPVLLDELRLDEGGWGAELLLAGDRLLVLQTAFRHGDPGRPLPVEGDGGIGDTQLRILPVGTTATTVTVVDVADPSALWIRETLTLDGEHLSARVVDGLVRIVVRSEPTGLPFAYPEGGGLRAEEEATRRNREVITASTAEQWLPYAIHVDADGRRSEGPLLDCASVSRPREFSGLGTVTVLTLDPATGAEPIDATAVLGAGETISASADRLYVATNRWVEPAGTPPTDALTTEIHAFDITAPQARHVASGSVPGHLLNQFSLSEHRGHLRVATTEGHPWWAGERPQESRVTVLAEEDGALVEVGSVGGLGVDERIYAVRFLGDVAYVVTFREVDPLYTIDLGDPRSPRVRGELKIPGYSAYLHPIGDGLVLGVGQDATEEGRSLGAQVSLFDVQDPDAPRRLAVLPLGEGATTDVEHDHRAFLHWPASGLAVVPVQRWGWDEATRTEDVEVAAVGFVADRAGIHEVGRASHLEPPALPDGVVDPDAAWSAAIRRTLVTGDRLVTVSARGVLISDLATFTPRGFAAFAGAPGR